MGEDEDSDSDEDDEYDGCEETSLEAYTTPLDEDDCDVDEYNIFKQVITSNKSGYVIPEVIQVHVQVLGGLQGSNPAWYGQLTGHLTEVGVRFLSHAVIANWLLSCIAFISLYSTGAAEGSR